MPRLFSNISDSILQSLNESVYEDNKKVKNAKKQYDIESFKKPHIMRGTVDTENVGSTKSIEKKIERTPYKRPHKATKKIVAEGDNLDKSNDLNLSLKDVYMKNFPEDSSMFDSIRDDSTLQDLLDALKSGKDVYEVIFGETGGDSFVRENFFNVLSEVLGVDYNDIYDMWIGNSVDESDKSGCLKEADSPFVDNLISDIEDGMFSWEEIARACLKYMSDEDIRDMCRSNEFYNMDDLDEEAKGEKENGGYKVDEQIYKISQVLIPEVEGLSNKLKEKIDYLENRENKSDREQVELEKLKSAYKSFDDALNSMKAVKEDS